MHLWNDYEGKTIANIFSLGSLVRPEGRSALFALSGGAEAPALIRLTESINDESQMLACWSRVSQVKQENLVVIKRFGETTFEGTPLTYAVMEPADANLDDLLKERPLTPAEAIQVATSLVAALRALHAKNLVHGHIVAGNVLAVGETVKLRGDCVRECVVDGEFTTPEDCARMMQRDVHDLALLLLRVLTLETQLKPGLKLAEPFNRIIPSAVEGAWGLAEIDRALPRPAPSAPPAAKQAALAQPAKAPTAASTVPVQPQLNFAPAAEKPAPAGAQHDNPLHFQRRVDAGTRSNNRRATILAGLAVVATLVVVMLVHFSGSSSKNPPAPAQGVVSQPAPQVVVRTPPAAHVASPAAARVTGNAAVSATQAGWYVIAYTFNRADQAAIRVAAIAKKDPSLQPKIVAPGGHSPYLIALGGPMSRPQAEALQKRARDSGLPRDTFVRNYKGN
jgi:hypothetical protein